MNSELSNKFYFRSENYKDLEKSDIKQGYDFVRDLVFRTYEDILPPDTKKGIRDTCLFLLMYKRVTDPALNLTSEEKVLRSVLMSIDPFVEDFADSMLKWGETGAARVNQMIAQNMISVGNTPLGSKERESFENFNYLFTYMAEQESVVGSLIKLAINSASAQAAVTNLAKVLNFDVLFPDIYSQDQIHRWDSYGGVDLAAIDKTNKVIFLVDVKAHTTSTQLVLEHRATKDRYLDLRPSILEDIKKECGIPIEGFKVNHILAGVPLDRVGITLLGEVKDKSFAGIMERRLEQLNSPTNIKVKPKKKNHFLNNFSRLFKSK